MASEYHTDNMNVAQAAAIKQEIAALFDGSTPEEREWLEAEIQADPVYSRALEISGLVGEIMAIVGAKVEYNPTAESETDQSPAVATDELLRELDLDHEAIARSAEIQKADISNIHAVLDGYSKQLTAGGDTKKESKQLLTYLRQSFKETWQSVELADEPMRLKNILESIASKTEIPVAAKTAVEDYILEEVKKYVRSSAAAADPDTIGRRIEASLLPGIARQQLQNVLLGAYFHEAEFDGKTETVLSNYERFLAGIMRVAGDKPELAQAAIEIAQFNSGLLPEDSLYVFRLMRVPQIRVDQPELFGRAYGAIMSMYKLSASLNSLESIKKPENPLRRLSEAADSFLDGRQSKKSLRAFRKNYGHVASVEIAIAKNHLDDEEFDKRYEVIRVFGKILTDPQLISDLISDHMLLENEYSSLASYVGEYLTKEYPDMAEFIHSLIDADSRATAELANYIGDFTIFNNDSIHRQADFQKIIGPLFEKIKKIHPEAEEIFAGKDIGQLMDFLKENTLMQSRPTGDGHILELYSAVGEELTDQEWLLIFEEYAQQIENAKEQLKKLPRTGRQAYSFGSPDDGVSFNIRLENEEDKRAYHSIDKILGENAEKDEDYSEAEVLAEAFAEIENSRLEIMQTRRRFINERGIYYQDSDDTGATLKITINKHPANPQYFVCSLELKEGETTLCSKVLMDPSLKFDIGNKKVRSPVLLAELNSIAAEVLAHFMCQEAVETEEGTLSQENNTLTARIAHLRLLQDGHQYSYDAWVRCLEAEGLDLEVLSDQQQVKWQTDRKSTYVSAVKRDDLDLGPLRIYIPEYAAAA